MSRCARLIPQCILRTHARTQRKEREFRARLDSVARLYGVAAAMRLKTEKEVLATQAARLPGLPSSHVGLETVLGTDETIDFEDVLNGESQQPRG